MGAEGKAGVAAIDAGDMAKLDVSTLAQKLFVDLPSWAVLVFIPLLHRHVQDSEEPFNE